MKAYTNIEQSKKLAEILPLESADMGWNLFVDETTRILPIDDWDLVKNGSGNVKFSPAWSLAALLSILPNEIVTDNRLECHYQIDIRKYDWYDNYDWSDNTTLYQIAYGNNRGLSDSWNDMVNTGEKENLIDCCVQMTIRLHELKLL